MSRSVRFPGTSLLRVACGDGSETVRRRIRAAAPRPRNELLEPFVDNPVVVTCAVTCTCTCAKPESPPVAAPRTQVMLAAVIVHGVATPSTAAESTARFAGSESVSFALTANTELAFVTSNVYVTD